LIALALLKKEGTRAIKVPIKKGDAKGLKAWIQTRETKNFSFKLTRMVRAGLVAVSSKYIYCKNITPSHPVNAGKTRF
jgi:hypothetical protein